MNTIRFSRSLSDIVVEYKATIKNVNDQDENFTINHPSKVNSYIERQLFYHFDRKKWTLNEMIFFANNNQLCLAIYNAQGLQLIQYGICFDCSQGFEINDQCFMINNQLLQIN